MKTNSYRNFAEFSSICKMILFLQWSDAVRENNAYSLNCGINTIRELALKFSANGYYDRHKWRFDLNEHEYWISDDTVLSRTDKKSVYDDVSTEYDCIYDTAHYAAEDKEVSSFIYEFCPDAKSALEVGCATGSFSKLYKNYTGIDLSHGMINVAKNKYPDKTFQVASFESFYTEEKFDYIFMNYGTASYIREDVLLRKIQDMLQPNGKYFLMYYNQGYFPLAHLGLTGSVDLVRKDSYVKLGNYSVVRGIKNIIS
ncbi:MAG: methyltransferase domain-containing protein [Planctomycetaceae bacterium]|jgi:SAM-dependent methyltransferase|nr:methyltransferase domain-containing protein [Planctomycetaceae bacterium]